MIWVLFGFHQFQYYLREIPDSAPRNDHQSGINVILTAYRSKKMTHFKIIIVAHNIVSLHYELFIYK